MEINRDNLLSLIQSGIKRLATSVSRLERDAGVPKDTIRDFLRGKTQVLRADKLQKILNILEPQQMVPITGYIGADAEIRNPDEDSKQKDKVPCPPGFDPSDLIAAQIKGDGMLPMYPDGWVIYYTRNQNIPIPPVSGGYQVPYAKTDKDDSPVFAAVLGKPCIVGLADKRVMLGTLKTSAQNKGYDLINHNASDLHNISPAWAAKIVFIKTE